MRRMVLAVLVAGLVWLFAGSAGPAIFAGDNGPDGNGTLPALILMGGDNGPDGNG
jgi:hypothetical protein